MGGRRWTGPWPGRPRRTTPPAADGNGADGNGAAGPRRRFPWVWRLGKFRRSTLIMLVAWLGLLALFLYVRPVTGPARPVRATRPRTTPTAPAYRPPPKRTTTTTARPTTTTTARTTTTTGTTTTRRGSTTTSGTTATTGRGHPSATTATTAGAATTTSSTS